MCIRAHILASAVMIHHAIKPSSKSIRMYVKNKHIVCGYTSFNPEQLLIYTRLCTCLFVYMPTFVCTVRLSMYVHVFIMERNRCQ